MYSIRNGSKRLEPTVKEVMETVALIHDKTLLLDQIFLGQPDIREGYHEAIEILLRNKRSYDQISENVITDRGWIIALIAVDYLNGECDRKVLINIWPRCLLEN